MVMAAPTAVLAAAIWMTPAVETVAPPTLPPVATAQAAPTVVGVVPALDCMASVTQVLAELAASISSDTLARTV